LDSAEDQKERCTKVQPLLHSLSSLYEEAANCWGSKHKGKKAPQKMQRVCQASQVIRKDKNIIVNKIYIDTLVTEKK